MKLAFAAIAAALGLALVVSLERPVQTQASTPLFQEAFEDTSFPSRGWYDGTGATLSTAEFYGGARSYECHFPVGGMICAGGTPSRHLFTPTDSVYVSFYIKHSTNFVGSGRPYHPHMFYVLTTEDVAYVGPAYTYLTAYIEAFGGVPDLAIQDGRNIDEARIGQDLTNVTEQRAVAGCNGDSDGYGLGACYPAGSVHWNSKSWTANGQVYFDNTAGGPRYKGNWHLVEAYFRLNSIVNGKGVKDGILRYWYDGTLIIDSANVMMRTAVHPNMKFNQFLISPWIGDGSPADQRFWVDNLLVATARPATPPAPPGGGASARPERPANLSIVGP